VIGDAIETQATTTGDGARREFDPAVASAATSGSFPVLLAAAGIVQAEDLEARFEFGLSVIIDGLRTRLALDDRAGPA
jgi:hypothetical protein